MACLIILVIWSFFGSLIFGVLLRSLSLDNDLVDYTVFPCFLPAHEEISIGIMLNFLQGLAGMVRQDVVQSFAHSQYLFGLDLHIGCLALKSPQGLVDKNTGMWQAKPFFSCSGCQQESTHAGSLS